MKNKINIDENFWKEAEKRHKRGKVMGGIFVIIIGLLFLGRELGMEIPNWLFSWKTFLIGIGLVIGVKNNFKRIKWLIPVVIGSVFLLCDLYPELGFKHLIWPIALILLGLIIIFKPRNPHHNRLKKRMHKRYHSHDCYQEWNEEFVNDDRIDFTTFMGGVKKNIVSKNFKGGDIANVLSGAEINLSQADFEGTVTLEITNVLGGIALVIPANWEIKSELTSVMGSMEDNRIIQTTLNEEIKKVLIIKGTVFMGGIEIKN